MNSDDLLTKFRSEVPPPDDAAVGRIYALATADHRRGFSRRQLTVAVAAVAAVGASVATVMFGGSPSTPKPPANIGGDKPFVMGPGADFTRVDGKLTSISFTIEDDHFSSTPNLDILVAHTDTPLDQLRGKNPATQVVFSEQLPMTATGSTEPDTAWWTLSGTLSPGDWSGGCGDGTYGLRFAVSAAGTSITYAFDHGPSDQQGFSWFRCNAN